jgi:hypothetical protein
VHLGGYIHANRDQIHRHAPDHRKPPLPRRSPARKSRKPRATED